MGQAVIDLPDPLDAPMPVPAVGADDLISQLAGAEIDRLLAEADAEHAPPAKPPTVAPAPSAPVPEIASPLREATPTANPVTLITAIPAEPVDDLSSQLNELLDGIDAPAAATPIAPTPTSALQPVTEAPRPTAAEEIAAELDAQAALAQQAEVASPVEGAHATKPAPEEDLAPSLLVRVLEWINTPLLAQPDAFREAIGKLAIVTLLNAFAVFLYVLLFRRH